MSPQDFIIGIDPGSSGAFVVLDATNQPIEWGFMPTLKLAKALRVNAPALAAMLRPFAGRAIARVELVGAMPGQGVSSMFSFGHATGVIYGVLGALEIEVSSVTPVVWKKAAGLPAGSDKEASRARGIHLWPAWRDLDPKAKGQALAEAAMIARFGGGRA